MKASEKAVVLIVPATVLMLMGVFARSLGLPETAGLVIFLISLMLLLLGYRETIKPRESTPQTPVPIEHHQTRRFWVLIAIMALLCVALPFLLPLTGLNLPLDQRVLVSAVTFTIYTVAAWFDVRKGLA